MIFTENVGFLIFMTDLSRGIINLIIQEIFQTFPN